MSDARVAIVTGASSGIGAGGTHLTVGAPR